MSCKKSREVLDQKQITISSAADARKERIDADAAWERLQSASRIIVAKGRNVREFAPQHDERAAILNAVMGPRGNLRAPTLQLGDRFIVGFNAEMYEKELEHS